MKTYILLLRGINVSGHNKIKMADLKNMLENIGLESIKTYIQSGNVVFNSGEEDPSILEQKVHSAIYNEFGFEVPVLILESNCFIAIIDKSPWDENEDFEENKCYFVLLKNTPKIELIQLLEAEKFSNEVFSITKKCVFLKCNNGYGKAKCNNNFFEGKLKVQATTRNYKTMVKLLGMAKTN